MTNPVLYANLTPLDRVVHKKMRLRTDIPVTSRIADQNSLFLAAAVPACRARCWRASSSVFTGRAAVPGVASPAGTWFGRLMSARSKPAMPRRLTASCSFSGVAKWARTWCSTSPVAAGWVVSCGMPGSCPLA